MLNQVVVVGRLTKDINLLENDKQMLAKIVVATPRSFKNADGEYETDFIPCTLYGSIATNTSEYCKKGDLIGIKGRLQCTDGNFELVAEKVTFLSSTRKED